MFWALRLPRAILATLVGAGLAITGAALQAVTRNPLADPHLPGISSGAAFGSILALLHTGLFLGLATVPPMALGGAMLARLPGLGGTQPTRATSSDRMGLAGANMLISLGDPRAAHKVVFWMLGGLGLAQWTHPIWPLSVLVPLGLCIWLRSGDLNAMTVGNETAAPLGIPVARFHLQVFVAGAMITGTMVAFFGMIALSA